MGTQHHHQRLMMTQQKGFTKLELIIGFILLLALYGVLSIKLATLSESAEKASVYATLGQIQKQISLREAKLYIGNIENDPVLKTLNPFLWAEPQPKNYGGELTFDQLPEAKSGLWYFITDQDQVFYRVKRNNYLKINGETGTDLIFVLKLNEILADNIANRKLGSVRLEALQPFTWVINDSTN